MSSFADAFYAIARPELRRACRMQALAVARERCDFTDAHTAVMAQARRRGSSHLPSPVMLDLMGWVDTTILKTIADIEIRREAAREIVDETLEAMWATMA